MLLIALLLSVKLCRYLIFVFRFRTLFLATLQEAERLEQENASRLLETRRLSLIVDLDQTIIHAACDPTVGEWMNDKNNKNHPATKVSWLLRNMCMHVISLSDLQTFCHSKDIKQFVLPGSPLVYYIKLRPKLQEFLKEVTKQYELHIYTMGTRNYAEAVANKIDPDRTIFRERILSRDESGSKCFRVHICRLRPAPFY